MKERCDQIPNCEDRSDEMDCQTVILPQGYRKDIVPIQPVCNARDPKAYLLPPSEIDPTSRNVSREFVPLDLEIRIRKVKVVSMEMDEVQHYITFQFRIVLTWRDQRVVFHNLKQDISLNPLSTNSTNQLWLPLLIYRNTDDEDTTRLGLPWEEWTTKIQVHRKGTAYQSSLEDVDEADIFVGSENSLTMTQVYKRKFQCLYVLDRYPFDTQVRSTSLSKSRVAGVLY